MRVFTVFSLGTLFRYFWKAKAYSYLAWQKYSKIGLSCQNGSKLKIPHEKLLQNFFVIKCIEASEVSVVTPSFLYYAMILNLPAFSRPKTLRRA